MIEKNNRLRSESGFTLIEAILSLVVLGIMGAVVGFGFSIMAQVYVNNTNMVTVTTKTEIAMERLRKELMHIKVVDGASSNGNSITYTSLEKVPDLANPGEFISMEVSHAVLYSNNVLSVDVDGLSSTLLDQFPLLDGIETFSFTYFDNYTDTTGDSIWTDGKSRIIEINLTMEQVGSVTSAFNYETRVMPRNL